MPQHAGDVPCEYQIFETEEFVKKLEALPAQNRRFITR